MSEVKIIIETFCPACKKNIPERSQKCPVCNCMLIKPFPYSISKWYEWKRDEEDEKK